MSRPLALAVLLGALLGGCATSGAGTPAAAAPAGQDVAPMRFRRMRAMLDQALAEASRGDAGALRARSPALSTEGLALLRAVLPHDVARQDVPRYEEGRARFGEALKHWVTVVESGSDAQVLHAIRLLDDATRGWVDAYLGRQPDTSI